VKRLPAGVVERVDMHRVRAGLDGVAGGFCDCRGRARSGRVDPVAIERNLQEG
jgi:hypothetical protein